MANTGFDPENTLANVKLELTPKAAIELGIDLCATLELLCHNQEGHGSIWPGNLTLANGRIYIGPAVHVDVKELDPRALEFLAPEQFWNGECTPASDVYSIGLLIYTTLNGGNMPFTETDTPESSERATALRSRMRGVMMPYPRIACRELGEVIIKATAFDAKNRYQTPAEFRDALQHLSEGAYVAAAVPVMRLTKEEIDNARSYKVDKEFETIDPAETAKAIKPKKEKKEPPLPVKESDFDDDEDATEFRKPKRSLTWLLPVITLVAMVIAIALLLHSCADAGRDHSPTYTLPLPTNSITQTAAPKPSAEPVEPTEAPVEPTEEPEPTPTPVVEHSYQVFIENKTWAEAKQACEDKGGHLVTIDNQEEFEKVVAAINASGATYVWVGCQRGADDVWYNVTGEPMAFANWDYGEPSYRDLDGTVENCVLLWYRNGSWVYNDQRNDLVSILPAVYSGKIAYVCEFGG